VTKVFAAFA